MKTRSDDKSEDLPAVFVIEVCCDCRNHSWNTHHDESKYRAYYDEICETIKFSYPSAEFHMNCVPKKMHEHDVYCNLVFNNDEKNPHFAI